MKAIWRWALATLLPAQCVGCRAGGTYLCDGCLRTARRLPAPSFQHGAFAFDAATCPFAYEGVPRTAVHRLKYSGLRAIAPFMAAPMADALALGGLRADVIVPVPLHPKRLRQRGHNQAALLAKEVGRLLDGPVLENALVRQTYEQPQVRAAAREARMANVADAFAVGDGGRLVGASVVLVDDVMTTGSTLDSAAGALKEAGARRIHALTFAREP